MDKYSGCNKVESVSYAPQKQKAQKVKRSRGTLLARLAVALALVGVICAVAYLPALSAVRETLKTVICYDMFGHTDIGSTPIITRLF